MAATSRSASTRTRTTAPASEAPVAKAGRAAPAAKAARGAAAEKAEKAEKATKAEKAEKAAARTFTITELAQEFDITPRAIRFYEDVGLLTPARSGRNRVYTPGDRTRLKLTLRGKRLGLSLGEIKQLVHMYDSDGDTRAQLEAFLGVLKEHRVQLEQQRDDIQVTLEEISQHEDRCRRLLGEIAGSKKVASKRA